MTTNNDAPFDNATDPKPTSAKTKNRAKILARKAMKKAAMKEEVKPKSAQELNPGLQQKIDAASNAQKPRPLSGMRPIDRIKLMTRKEEVELDEEFINGREYASHGLMHPKHAGEQIHQPSDRYVDFYASGTGDKMSGKVKSNNGKVVQIQAHPKLGDGKLHKFRVTANLPQTNEEVEQIDEVSIGTLDNYLHKRWTQVFNGHKFKKPGSVMKKNVATATKNANAFDKGRDVTVGSDNPTVQRRLKDRSKKLLSKGTPTEKMYHNKGVKSASTNEEVEQIDELSKDFLTKKYGPKAMRAHLVAKAAGKRKTANKRAAGVNLASAKAYPNQFKDSPKKAKVPATNEEVEQIDELSKKALSSYVGKAYWDQGKRMSKAGQAYGYIAATERRKATHGEIGNAIGGRKEVRRDKSRDKGVERALSRLAKEDYTIEASASERDRYEEPKPKLPGRPTPIPNGLPGRPGNRPKPIPPMGALKKIEEKAKGYEKLASAIKNRAAKKKLAVEAHDPVGKEDADINNDGEVNNTDVFLHRKRKAIGKAISNRLAAKAGK